MTSTKSILGLDNRIYKYHLLEYYNKLIGRTPKPKLLKQIFEK